MDDNAKPMKSLKTPFTAGRRPQPDIKALVDRVMDPNGDRAAVEELKKEHTPDGK
jgi:hypothetical protein